MPGLPILIGPHYRQTELGHGGLDNILHQEIRVATILRILFSDRRDVETNLREIRTSRCAFARGRNGSSQPCCLALSCGRKRYFFESLFNRDNPFRPTNRFEQAEKLRVQGELVNALCLLVLYLPRIDYCCNEAACPVHVRDLQGDPPALPVRGPQAADPKFQGRRFRLADVAGKVVARALAQRGRAPNAPRPCCALP